MCNRYRSVFSAYFFLPFFFFERIDPLFRYCDTMRLAPSVEKIFSIPPRSGASVKNEPDLDGPLVSKLIEVFS